MNESSIPQLKPIRLAALAFLVAGLSSQLLADDTLDADRQGPRRIQKVFVPANNPSVWPEGDWIPLRTAEFLRLEASIEKDAKRPAVLHECRYLGRLVNDTLQNGTFHWTADNHRPSSELIDLGQPTIAIQEVNDDGRSALWGTSEDRRHLLQVHSGQTQLTGRWSAVGREVFTTTEFHLVFPTAVMTTLELDLPDNRSLQVDDNIIPQRSPADLPGWSRWTLHLGRRSDCHLRVTRQTTSDRAVPLYASQTLQYVLEADGIQIQADIIIDSGPERLNSLVLTIPGSMQVQAVSAGLDTALPFSRRRDGSANLLDIDMSEIRLSKRMVIRIRGKLPLLTNRPRSLPRFGLRQGRWLSIRRKLLVSPPLRLIDIDKQDCGLISSALSSETGDVLEFEDLTLSARLRVMVDVPAPQLTATVVSHLNLTEPDPLLRSVLLMRAAAGSTFLVRCAVPAEWDVTHVGSLSNTGIAQWAVSRVNREDETCELQVELSRPIRPGDPADLVVEARRTSSDGETSVVPVVVPIVTGDLVSYVALEVSKEQAGLVHANNGWESVSIEQLTSEWGGVLPNEMAQSADPVLAFQSSEMDREQLGGPFRIELTESVLRESREATADVAASSETHTANLQTALIGKTQLLTKIEEDDVSTCRHRATIRFESLSQPTPASIALPIGARLLSATDGFGRRLAVHAGVVMATVTSDNLEFELQYESKLTHRWLGLEADVPLPTWDGLASSVGWQIDLPDVYRVGPSTIGGSLESTHLSRWNDRLFGPFASEQSNGKVITNGKHLRTVNGGIAILRLEAHHTRRMALFSVVSLLVGMLVMSLPSVGARFAQSRWLTTGVLTTIACITILVPDELAKISGGLLMGVILGWLMALSWRRQRDVASSTILHSTRVRTTARVAVSILVAAFVSVIGHHSFALQPSDDVGPASLSTGRLDEIIQVLVPVDDAPQQQSPLVVYLQADDYERWNDQQSRDQPSSLIRSADYRVIDSEDLGDDSHARVVAAFDIALLQPGEVRYIGLPIQNVLLDGVQPCLVNGESADALPQADGRGLLVDLHSIDSLAGPLVKSEIGTLQIELRVRTELDPDSEPPLMNLEIPPVLNSQATFRVGDPDQPPIRVHRHGAMSPPRADGVWRIHLGGVDRLRVVESADHDHLDWLRPMTATTQVNLLPLRMQVVSELDFQVLPSSTPSSQNLQLQLPSTAVVRSIQAPRLIQQSIERLPDRGIGVALRFSQLTAETQKVNLRFDLVEPRPSDMESRVVPKLSFLSRPDHSKSFDQYTTTLSTMSPFRVASPLQSLPSNSPRSTDVTVRTSQPEVIPVTLQSHVAQIEYRRRQTLAVYPNRVELFGQLELMGTLAGRILHINIPNSLIVDSVALAQAESDLVERWSQPSDERLTLFLNEQPSTNSTIAIRGHWSTEPRPMVSPVPFSLEGADVSEYEEVEVWHDPNLRVESIDPAEHLSRTLDGTGDAPLQIDDQLTIHGHFELPSDAEPVRWQVTPVTPPLDYESVSRLQLQEGVINNMTHIKPVEQRSGKCPVTFSIPDGWSIEAINCTGGDWTRLSEDNRTGLVTGVLNWTSDTEPVLSVETSLSVPESLLLTVTLPQLENGECRNPKIVIPSDTSLQILSGARLEDAAMLPEWMPGNDGVSSTTVQVLFVTGDPIELQINRPAKTGAVPLIEHVVWHENSGHWLGTTRIAIEPPGSLSRLKLRVPESLSLMHVPVDQELISNDSLDPGIIEFDKSEYQQTILHWQSADASLDFPSLDESLIDVSANTLMVGNVDHDYRISDLSQVDPLPSLAGRDPDTGTSIVEQALRDSGWSQDDRVPDRETSPLHLVRSKSGRSIPITPTSRTQTRIIMACVTAALCICMGLLMTRPPRISTQIESFRLPTAWLLLSGVILLWGSRPVGIILCLVSFFLVVECFQSQYAESSAKLLNESDHIG